MYELKVKVHYPLQSGRICIRTEHDWNLDIEALAIHDSGTCFEFRILSNRPNLQYKAVLHPSEGEMKWAQGTNRFLMYSLHEPGDDYPYFFSAMKGSISELIHLPSKILARPIRVRIYLPPGYQENKLRLHRLVIAHDGNNIFFASESFLGQEWEFDENLDTLDAMSLIHQVLLVGVHANNRHDEYTQPGYETYGKAIVEELLPWIHKNYRTLQESRFTATAGSSLGGLVSFYLAWQWPHIFGNAACLSTTFDYENNLYQRVIHDEIESRKQLRLYLDSGWPNDNYEATLTMAMLLHDRGLIFGQNLWHFAFPLAKHNEVSWAARIHLPLQLFASKLRQAAEKQIHIKPNQPSVPLDTV